MLEEGIVGATQGGGDLGDALEIMQVEEFDDQAAPRNSINKLHLQDQDQGGEDLADPVPAGRPISRTMMAQVKDFGDQASRYVKGSAWWLQGEAVEMEQGEALSGPVEGRWPTAVGRGRRPPAVVARGTAPAAVRPPGRRPGAWTPVGPPS